MFQGWNTLSQKVLQELSQPGFLSCHCTKCSLNICFSHNLLEFFWTLTPFSLSSKSQDYSFSAIYFIHLVLVKSTDSACRISARNSFSMKT